MSVVSDPCLATLAPMLRISVAAGILTTLAVISGCAHEPTGLGFITVERGSYELAFDAACEVSREEGLVPQILDRRAGSIDTGVKSAGSVMEPWAWQDLTAADVVEATFGFERRRAHFEFIEVGFRPLAPEGTAPLAGPVLPGSSRGTGTDVPNAIGNLELRVSVSVERQFRPGYQGPAYTRSLGRFSTDVTTKDDPLAPRDRSNWTPIARDERLERVLIDRIAAKLSTTVK